MVKKTYIDSGVLISAFKGVEEVSERAIDILADVERVFVVSDILTMECVCPAVREGHTEQAEFCSKFISEWERIPLEESASKWAIDILARNQIQHMDLLHIAIAVDCNADDFVTTESETKPFFTIGAPINVISIARSEATDASGS